MFCWAKRVEAQRAQSAIINSLTEAESLINQNGEEYIQRHPRRSSADKNAHQKHVDIVVAAIPQEMYRLQQNWQLQRGM